MAEKSLIFIGGGGHCKSCIDVVEAEGSFHIAGILDAKQNIGKEISGYRVTGSDDDIERLINEGHHFVITIGDIKKTALRRKIYEAIKLKGGKLATIVSPKAHVSRTATIGEGTVVFHHAIVNANAKVGINNIVNSAALVEHDCNTGAHCHVSTRSVINGECSIGDNVYVGSNAVIVNGVSICSDVIIGAGAVINKPITEPATYVGNPFRKLA